MRGAGPTAVTRRALYAALLVLGVPPAAGDPASSSHPWEGEARRGWVDAAAKKAFALGETPNLAALPELCVGPCPPVSHVTGALMGGAPAELHAVGIYEANEPDVKADGRVTVMPVKI